MGFDIITRHDIAQSSWQFDNSINLINPFRSKKVQEKAKTLYKKFMSE